MQQLFPANGAKVPQLRFKGFKGEWEENLLGNVLIEINKEPVQNYSEIELLSVSLYGKGIVSTGKYPRVTLKGRPYYRRYKDEILIGKQNFHNGSIGLVNKDKSGLICSNAIFSFDVQIFCIKKFILFYCLRRSFLHFLDDYLSGTGQKEINLKDMNKIRILLPSKQEQQKIASCLSSLDELITAYNDKLERFKRHKKGLMQQLFVNQT